MDYPRAHYEPTENSQSKEVQQAEEERDRESDLILTKQGNLLSVNCDATSQISIKNNNCLLKNPLSNGIILHGLLLVWANGSDGSLFQLTINDI